MGSGVRFRANDTKRWWRCQSISCLGSIAETDLVRVEITGSRLEKGQELCSRIITREPAVRVSARLVLQWLVLGGFCNLGGGWDVANDSRRIGSWGFGLGSADCGLPRAYYRRFPQRHVLAAARPENSMKILAWIFLQLKKEDSAMFMF